jgi:hypothetical protein
VLGSDLYRQHEDYWGNFVRFSKHMTLARSRHQSARPRHRARRHGPAQDPYACPRDIP